MVKLVFDKLDKPLEKQEDDRKGVEFQYEFRGNERAMDRGTNEDQNKLESTIKVIKLSKQFISRWFE